VNSLYPDIFMTFLEAKPVCAF